MLPRTVALTLNTLLLSGATCAVSVPLGTVLAWLLVRTDLPGRRVGVLLLGLLLLVPLYLHAAAWQAAFGVQGWYTLCYMPLDWWDGWPGAIWVHATAAVPWVVLITGAGFLLVEPELEEQALLDGSPWQVLRRVTLRAALPAVGVAALWVAVTTAGEIAVTDMFRVRTYAEEVYTDAAIGPEPGAAPLGVLPGVGLTALLVAAGLVLCVGLTPRDRPATVQRRMVFHAGPLRGPLTIAVALVLLVLIGVPLASLCYNAGVEVVQTDTGRLRTWLPGKFLSMVVTAPWRYRREFGWSLGIGTLAAAGAVAAAIPLAWLARRGGRRALPALVTAAACLAVPGPVLGLAIVWLLNRPECPWLVFLYDRSILAPWLAMWLRGLPVATIILWHAFRTLPREVLESAAVDGAGPAVRLWRIVLPLRWPALAVAFLVALAVAIGELSATASILVVPPGVETLSIRVFGLLHYGVDNEVAGICLVLMAMFAAVAGAVAWLAAHWGRQRAAE
jgi:iron(III) transport system permease protein